MTDLRILHCFADDGIESEALAAYGHVTRVGLDPVDNQWTDKLIACDAREVDLNRTFDLGLFHPPCQRWAVGSHIEGEPTDRHDDLIPVAREIAQNHCDEWIIENVPQAPLRDPVVLNGGMFGSPLHYERAFETSYHVAQPRNQRRLCDQSGPFAKHHENGDWTGSVELWKSAKGYTGDHNSRALKRTAVPRAYINYLVRPLLEQP